MRPGPKAVGVAGALALSLGLFMAPARGGQLEVNAESRYTGDYGLEAILAPCSPSDLTIGPNPATVSGSHVGCNTVVATGVEVVQPGAVFKAGTSIQLRDGFSVGAGAEFTALVNSSVNSRFAFVQYQLPDDTVSYSAEFFTNLVHLDLGSGDQIDHFVGYSATGQVLFRLSFKHYLPLNEDRLVLAARQDDGTLVETAWGEEILIPAGYNRLSVQWRSAPGTGKLQVAVNQGQSGGQPFVGLSGLDNDTARLAYVRWGAVSGQIGSTTGSVYLDEFSSLP